MSATITVPRAFIWRRIHSLFGLWIVLFLMEHLLTNSQAALWLGDNGKGFVDLVNALHNLPYLQVIEVTLIGVPLLVHAVLGVKYLFTAKSIEASSDGSKPALRYGRNRAYSWQRITSWILLIGLIGHVAKFRFLEYPEEVSMGKNAVYIVKIHMDNGLYTLSQRLGFTVYDQNAVNMERAALDSRSSESALVGLSKNLQAQSYDFKSGPVPEPYDNQKAIILSAAQQYASQVGFVSALEKIKLKTGECIAVAPDFGMATLLSVRDTFKQPIYIGLYTIFVLAACFHAFNGFWTFLITWGWVLKMSAQRAWVSVSVALMLIVLFLGLAAIWGTYWANLRY